MSPQGLKRWMETGKTRHRHSNANWLFGMACHLFGVTLLTFALNSGYAQDYNFAPDFDSLREQFANASHDSVKLRLGPLVSYYYLGSNPKLAKKVAIESLQFLHASENPVLQIKVIQNAADRYWEDGEYYQSIRLQRDALKIAEDHQLSYWAGESYHFIGLDHYYMANYDSALHYYALAKTEFLEIKDSVFVSRVENHAGLVYDQMGEYSSAIDQVLISMKMQEKLPGYNNGSYHLYSAEALDDSVFFRSRIDKSLADLDYEMKRGALFNAAQILRSIGMDYTSVRKFRLAITNFKKSAFYYRAVKFEPFLEDFGLAYEGLGLLDSAAYYYRMRLEKLLESGMRNAITPVYSRMGGLSLKRGKFSEALSFYEKALVLHEWMGNRLPIVITHLAMANVLEKWGRYKEALPHLLQSLELANQIKALPRQANAYEALHRIYNKLGQFEKSISALLKANELNRKLTEGEARLETAKLSFLYQSERKDRQLLELKEAALLQEAALRNRNLMIILAVASVLIVSAFGFLFYYRFRQKKRSSELLERQNRIIEHQNYALTNQNKVNEILLSEIHHRVKNNLQIISSLINLKSRQVSEETNRALQQLNGRIFSMGLIHEKLYHGADIQIVRLDLYLSELCEHLIESFTGPENKVALELDCNPINLDADRTLSCALICNELITNALKHAFTEDQPLRKIGLSLRHQDGLIDWVISDNGANGKLLPAVRTKSFGLRFVDELVTSKLRGHWNLTSEKGSVARISFTYDQNGKN